ncbi:MAG: hypothetical protein DRJ61_00575 [Acidobacteria bacterium]|nr:MAG: hypothetical protein DRJ61_00575 [Acidobacteriota bacterium]
MANNKTLTVEEFVEKGLNQFLIDITDKVFLMIQDNPRLRQDYLDLVSAHDELVSVHDDERLNAHIGKLIKKRLGLEAVMAYGQPAMGEPRSTLIKTYTKHCLKRGQSVG